MRLRGEDVSDGLRDWVKTELKEGPRQAYDLGKFFFSVSVGTIGAIAAIERLNPEPRVDLFLLVSLGLLALSILLALCLALPREYPIGGDTDLHSAYRGQIARTVCWSWWWFAVWAAGTGVGAWAIRV